MQRYMCGLLRRAVWCTMPLMFTGAKKNIRLYALAALVAAARRPVIVAGGGVTASALVLRTRVIPALESETRIIAFTLEQREREDRFRLKRVKAARGTSRSRFRRSRA